MCNVFAVFCTSLVIHVRCWQGVNFFNMYNWCTNIAMIHILTSKHGWKGKDFYFSFLLFKYKCLEDAKYYKYFSFATSLSLLVIFTVKKYLLYLQKELIQLETVAVEIWALMLLRVVQFVFSLLGSNNVQADKHTYFFLISALLKGNYTGDDQLLTFLMGTFMWNHGGTTVCVGNVITQHYQRRLMAVALLRS